MEEQKDSLKEAMIYWYLNYYPTTLWNADEKAEWESITRNLVASLKNTTDDKYHEVMNKILEDQMVPLGKKFMERFVAENNITTGIENMAKLIFSDFTKDIVVSKTEEGLKVEERLNENGEKSPEAFLDELINEHEMELLAEEAISEKKD